MTPGPAIFIVIDSALEPHPPTDGHYAAARCGRLSLRLLSTQSAQALEITSQGARAVALVLPDSEYQAFLSHSRRGQHALAWEELLQWARNECGLHIVVSDYPERAEERLVDLIDSHTELWDGIDGHQPSAPGAVLQRPRGAMGSECVHVFTVNG